MSLATFIPQVWSGKILKTLETIHVYAKVVNKDYEGEIKNIGDSVRIQTLGDVTISTYARNVTSITPENLHGADQVLHIDQSKYFAFEIDDVDDIQAKPELMSKYTSRAGYKLSDTLDDWLAALISAGVATANILTALTQVGVGASEDDAYEAIVDLGVKLDENDVPSENRWCIIPPWFEGVLRKDLRFSGYGTDKSRGTIRGEPIGDINGMTIYKSNNVPVTSSAYDVMAGWKEAATIAEQVRKVEAYRPESSFSDALKGLHLYGGKVTRPNSLAKVVCTAA